mmetsp:Transcript_116326/g.323326  ORF Transcript_116326/g.323326 Transcript_116326/m.323326 type:complete len:249 (-) Transcript_116326:120-866(-)
MRQQGGPGGQGLRAADLRLREHRPRRGAWRPQLCGEEVHGPHPPPHRSRGARRMRPLGRVCGHRPQGDVLEPQRPGHGADPGRRAAGAGHALRRLPPAGRRRQGAGVGAPAGGAAGLRGRAHAVEDYPEDDDGLRPAPRADAPRLPRVQGDPGGDRRRPRDLGPPPAAAGARPRRLQALQCHEARRPRLHHRLRAGGPQLPGLRLDEGLQDRAGAVGGVHAAVPYDLCLGDRRLGRRSVGVGLAQRGA